MSDLPISSINPNPSPNQPTPQPDPHALGDTVSNLNNILNSPADDTSDVDTIASPPQQQVPDTQMAPTLIQIDLKKNYKKPEVAPQPEEAVGSSYSGSPFGMPRPAESFTIAAEQNPTQPENIETLLQPEVEKSTETLKPEQPPEQKPQEQNIQQPSDLPLAKVVDLRKPADVPKVKKKDILQTASPLTQKANTQEDEFIASILGAHGN
jgi:hypothetical protein